MKICLALICCLALLPGRAEDWRQFRGSQGSGLAPGAILPVNLDAKRHLAWRSDLPGRGHSSPVILGDRVFVTCASGAKGGRLHVLCLDANTGAKRWERQFWATGRTTTHEKISGAAPTAASDGDRIFALFSSNDLFCLDLDGNLLWLRGLMRDYSNASNALGLSASPVVADGVFIAQIETDGEAFAIGIDALTGVNRWKIERPRRANWTSPLVLPSGNGKHRAALQSSAGVQMIEAQTGRELWNYSEGAATIPSSVIAGQVLYVPSNGITALQEGAPGQPPKQLWRAAHLRTATASPIVQGERIFVLNDAGILTCAEIAEGKRLWQLRLKGPFTASPVASAKHLYLVNEKGLLQVVDPTPPEGEVISELDLGETILSTPSIAGNAIYLRSDGHLWKLAQGTARNAKDSKAGIYGALP
jgi:outer membrane protein assembly factor BamB